MTPKLIQWTAAAIVAMVLVVGVRVALGPRGRKDGILYSGSIVTSGFVLAGIAGVILGEKNALDSLVLGVIFAYMLRARWRAARSDSTTLPGA